MGEEKLGLRFYWPFSLGSPPRGRGKVRSLNARDGLDGITPAWAGKSCCPFIGCGRCGDHPRVGGEKGGAW